MANKGKRQRTYKKTVSKTETFAYIPLIIHVSQIYLNEHSLANSR
jgi:hypothetical protein